jgi:hypothetical protein
VKGALIALLFIGWVPPVAGQVGYPPDKSPFRDLEYTREWTLFSGYFDGRRDPVGVAPRGGPMFGARYDARVTGPIFASLRIASAAVDRRVLDPTKPVGERIVATETVPMALGDVSFGLNLTGARTWHGTIPYVAAGVGVAADLRGRNDVGDYRFGAPFTMTIGSGIKWIPRNQWQLRLDWTSYIYQIRYPSNYYLRVGTDDPVRLPGDPRTYWRPNNAISLGVAYLYQR